MPMPALTTDMCIAKVLVCLPTPLKATIRRRRWACERDVVITPSEAKQVRPRLTLASSVDNVTRGLPRRKPTICQEMNMGVVRRVNITPCVLATLPLSRKKGRTFLNDIMINTEGHEPAFGVADVHGMTKHNGLHNHSCDLPPLLI